MKNNDKWKTGVTKKFPYNYSNHEILLFEKNVGKTFGKNIPYCLTKNMSRRHLEKVTNFPQCKIMWDVDSYKTHQLPSM